MSQFTPEQIQEILDIFFDQFAHRQYIGARYVPTFGRKDETSIEWDNTGTYEPLTIVLYQGNSYTSRQFVPVGVEIANNEYWANTGNYNAQVEAYRQEVLSFDSRITENSNKIATETTNRIQADSTLEASFDIKLNVEKTERENADTTLQNNINAEKTARENSDTTLQANINAETARATEKENANATLISGLRTDVNGFQSQLDNIIAQSGTSDTEVVQARTGVKGSAFTTLKDRLDAEAFTWYSVSNGDDLNEMTEDGFYTLPGSNANVSHQPDGVVTEYSSQGVLLVFKIAYSGADFPVWQIAFYYNLQKTFIRWKPTGQSFTDWKKLSDNPISILGFTNIFSGGATADLNDLTNGYYLMPYDVSNISNLPENDMTGRGVVVVFNSNVTTAGKWQVYFAYDINKVYIRWQSGENWQSWHCIASNNDTTLKFANVLGSTITDLNNCPNGYYYLTADTSNLSNMPTGRNVSSDGYGILVSFALTENNSGSITQTLFLEKFGEIWQRRRAGASSWQTWELIAEKNNLTPDAVNNTIIGEYTSTSYTGTTANEGKQFRIATYNVAKFHPDNVLQPGFPNDVYNEKLANFKRALMHIKADIIGFTEFSEYVDSSSAKATESYMLKPIYPFTAKLPSDNASKGNAIVSKNTISNVSYDIVTVNRPSQIYGTTTINGIEFAIAVIHPSFEDGASGNTSRLNEITTAMTVLSAMNADVNIIMGDFNLRDATDKANVIQACSSNGYIPANGGYAGWIVTTPEGVQIDNILVSDNCIINNVESMKEWYKTLYSDHYPLFVDITVTGV